MAELLFYFILNDLFCRRIYVESQFCLFQKAELTYKLTNSTIEKLKKLNALPNLAGVYANYSTYYFARSEYDDVSNYEIRNKILILFSYLIGIQVDTRGYKIIKQ